MSDTQTDTVDGLTDGTCRVCKTECLVDCMGYGSCCYPYDDATDRHKELVERRLRPIKGLRRKLWRKHREGVKT